ETLDGAVFARVLEQGLHVKPALAEDPAADIRNSDDLRPSLGEKSGRKGAEISKTLHGHASARQGHAQVFKQRLPHVRSRPRVNLWSSASVSSAGSTAMPPLAPPKGMLTRAVFQVMAEASARTSFKSVDG